MFARGGFNPKFSVLVSAKKNKTKHGQTLPNTSWKVRWGPDSLVLVGLGRTGQKQVPLLKPWRCWEFCWNPKLRSTQKRRAIKETQRKVRGSEVEAAVNPSSIQSRFLSVHGWPPGTFKKHTEVLKITFSQSCHHDGDDNIECHQWAWWAFFVPHWPPYWFDFAQKMWEGGRKIITITNTLAHTHSSLGKCQSKWESMLTFITVWWRGGARHGRLFFSCLTSIREGSIWEEQGQLVTKWLSGG